MDERLIASAKDGKKRAGQRDLLNYLAGKRLTQRQAIKAKCYDCSGMGENPVCDYEECSLLSFSPYNKKNKPTRARASDLSNSTQKESLL